MKHKDCTNCCYYYTDETYDKGKGVCINNDSIHINPLVDDLDGCSLWEEVKKEK
jgi:hypothetical protein